MFLHKDNQPHVMRFAQLCVCCRQLLCNNHAITPQADRRKAEGIEKE